MASSRFIKHSPFRRRPRSRTLAPDCPLGRDIASLVAVVVAFDLVGERGVHPGWEVSTCRLFWGLTAPVRVYAKAGWGRECVDAGLFETDNGSWIVAAMAEDLPDLWHRPDDIGPRTI